MEEWAYVLDVLPEGRPDGKRRFRREPIVYGLGVSAFKIFDLIPIIDAEISIGDKVYLGRDNSRRSQIERVRARVGYRDLTHTAQSELEFIIEDVVRERVEKFINFYNLAGPISRRYHSLELLPGLGKKTMEAIVAARKPPFKDFKDMEQRIPNLHHPEKFIAARIAMELRESDQKYRIFVK